MMISLSTNDSLNSYPSVSVFLAQYVPNLVEKLIFSINSKMACSFLNLLHLA